MSGKRAYGDYQTPPEFAEKVCLYLRDGRGVRPSAVVEPTCGVGNFVRGSLMLGAREYYGIEINPEYCDACRRTIHDKRVQIICGDIFQCASKSLIRDPSRTLVIGNPPWVTNGTLSVLGSGNLPEKRNFKGLKGLDAKTGAGNFDISEAVILRLAHEYSRSETLIAMLCKTSVARNVFQELKRTGIPFASCDLLEFDAFRVFGVRADACLLLIQLSERPLSPDVCNVYDFDRPETVKARIGVSNGQCRPLDGSPHDFDGRSCFQWRQGVKHDCAGVMELTLRDGVLENGDGEPADIEPDRIFPLVKSSMFKSPVIHSFSKFVIVTQRKAREPTEHLARELPKTWEYLNRRRARFERRKSSIYCGAPPFSLFGVGDYSYAPYKVGVSGFYKRPLFAVLYSDDGKPVMTDDASYFIGFDRYSTAYVAMLVLNSTPSREFLISSAFLDAKRPYTKKVLARFDFRKALQRLSVRDLTRTEAELGLRSFVAPSMYDGFKALLKEE